MGLEVGIRQSGCLLWFATGFVSADDTRHPAKAPIPHDSGGSTLVRDVWDRCERPFRSIGADSRQRCELDDLTAEDAGRSVRLDPFGRGSGKCRFLLLGRQGLLDHSPAARVAVGFSRQGSFA